MTQCKQLSLFDYNATASAAAAKRANTASGSSLRCSKILREPFLIVKNQVGPNFFCALHRFSAASHPQWRHVPGDSVILATPMFVRRYQALETSPQLQSVRQILYCLLNRVYLRIFVWRTSSRR